MAIAVVTERQWQAIFAPRVQQDSGKVKVFTQAARARRAAKVFRFHITHRQTAGNNGPGRRHKKR
jgi:hypothetical protein